MKLYNSFKCLKLNLKLISFERSNNASANDMKMDGSFPVEKSFFKVLELTFYSKLDWGSYIMSIVKTASKKIGALIRSMKFFSPEENICMKYCCHAWGGAPSCFLQLLDKRPVPHPDVFWYRLNGMGGQKNAPKKVLVTLFPYIFHVKPK